MENKKDVRRWTAKATEKGVRGVKTYLREITENKNIYSGESTQLRENYREGK
jgi:hypothetical protein